MKILRNIPATFKFYFCLRHLTKYKKAIEQAKISGDKEEERKNILIASSTWGKELCKMLKMDVNVIGKENLPTSGPIVYMSNHQSNADIPILASVLDTVAFGAVAKTSLAKIPIYGKWIKRINSVFLDRTNARASLKAISEGISLVNEGYSFIIFPEGTRSQSDEMNDFKPGAMKLATKPKVDIVPISISGTWHAFEEKGYVVPTTVNVTIHPSIKTAELSKEEIKNLPNKVHNIIKAGI